MEGVWDDCDVVYDVVKMMYLKDYGCCLGFPWFGSTLDLKGPELLKKLLCQYLSA